jgi:hypothetical protein
MKNLFFSIIFTLTIFVCVSYGCTLNGKTLSKFDPTKYVFIGKVGGYTKPLEFKKTKPENRISETIAPETGAPEKAVGLIVKIKESVFLPETPAADFEVFPLELGADCSILGTDETALQRQFPIDAEIRVVAKKTQILPAASDGKNIRLEIRPGEAESIAGNFYENGERMTNVDSIFDYRNFKQPTPADYTESFMPFLDAKTLLPDFEARKDLLRLEKSKSRTEKSQILNRLLYLPIDSRVSLRAMLKKYAANKDEFQDLYYKRLFEIEGLSDEDYKAIKKSVPLKYGKKYKNKV